MLSRLAEAALDLLLPPHCPSCAKPVGRQGTFCAPCFARLTFITEPLCDGCGLPFPAPAHAGALRLCSRCLDHPAPWRRARAALIYDDAARALVLPFKHGGRLENAACLAQSMRRAGAALLADASLLVPVPLHRSRLRQRGFNQSVLLARALGRICRLPVLADALCRTRATPSLRELSAAARAETLAGAIAARPRRMSAIQGARVVLIDDVMTSGATAGACARVLLEAGAAHVDVLAASRVADPRQDR